MKKVRRVLRLPPPLAVLLVTGLAAVAATAPAAGLEPPPDEPALPAGLEPRPEEPALPAGLESPPEEPALPSGLEPPEPELPAGLGTTPTTEGAAEGAGRPPFWSRLPRGLGGFFEARAAPRLRNDPVIADDFALAEARIQGEYLRSWGSTALELRGDLLLDAVTDQVDWDQRQLRLALRPASNLDLSIGRQILTWGTGDLLFINDMFPKDWNAFFSGRDTEYLKAPSDAVRLGWFNHALNLDLVYTPQFDPDRFIDGERFSFWSPLVSGPVGGRDRLRTLLPDRWLDDDEVALRLYRSAGAWELALYGYDGFWKSPGGFEPQSGRATFPPLRVVGASARGPVAGGIGNLELGYYDSRADPRGDDPFVNNDELRVLAGFEHELGKELTGGFQLYLERLLQYDAYRATLPAGPARDRDRFVVTVRITKLLLGQDLRLSWFSYWSPTDADAYLRPNASYRLNDRWTTEVGLNWFEGRHPWSFFGQFERGSNLYASIRFSV